MTVVYSDAEADIRYWLRHHPDLAPLHNGRVFFKIPAENPGTTDPYSLFPVIRLTRTGGGNQPGTDLPVRDLNMSLECWSNGPPQRSSFDGQGCRQLATAVESALLQLTCWTLLSPNGDTVCLDAAVTNVIPSDDPELGWPRIVVDSRWTVVPNS